MAAFATRMGALILIGALILLHDGARWQWLAVCCTTYQNVRMLLTMPTIFGCFREQYVCVCRTSPLKLEPPPCQHRDKTGGRKHMVTLRACEGGVRQAAHYQTLSTVLRLCMTHHSGTTVLHL